MTNPKKFFVVFVYALLGNILFSYAQCPTIVNPTQNFCDLESILVSDLQAIDNGGGVVWYATATSTTPLNNATSLINNEDYFADDSSGSCGSRERVVVNIVGPPVGLNFQGVCVEDPNEATISDLLVFGNDVQWYLSPTGGSVLSPTSILIDNTIYYADQSAPGSSCRTSRLSIFVNVGIVPSPTGNELQRFCVISGSNPPTISDLIANGNNIHWYSSASSATPLDPNMPLVDGQSYFATTSDPPCESDSRLEVTVELVFQNSAGSDANLDLCEGDTNIYNLFNSLGGSPESGGSWLPELNSGTGIFDPSIDPAGTYTYSVESPDPICSDAEASVTVSFITPPMAGTNGTLAICGDDINTYDLFDSLGGNPDVGGSWLPTLNSGTSVFNPALDSPGTYTYTVTSSNPACNDASASVTVSFIVLPNAGSNGSLEICEGDTNTFDLINSLGGTPEVGGVWLPELNSGTGVFNPAIDEPGVYTYTIESPDPACNDASASVTVSFIVPPNAGTNGNLEICENDTNTYNLFDSLGGAPDSGGTWLPALSSGTGIFDPGIDLAGTYTYTVLSSNTACGSASASIVVTFIILPDAGSNGNLSICEGDTNTFDLFNSLSGTPEVGGTWLPALNSGTGVFDPTIDAPGIYTYSIPSPDPACNDASAAVTVSFITPPYAGTDGSLEICENDTNTYDLLISLGGTPDSGGFWSPTLNSGTSIFNPSIDLPGTYTYTVPSRNNACDDASASVTVSFIILPDAGTNGSLDICEGDTNTFDLFNSLGGTPETGGAWTPALNSGTGVFDPNIDSAGTYTYTILSPDPACNDASALVTVSFITPPDAGTNGSLEICENDTNTYDLLNSLGGTPDTNGTWLPALHSGTNIFDPTIDLPGTYIYTVFSSALACGDASASVTVSFIVPPDAGSNGSLEICENDTNTYDLFNSLGGAPETGGTWSPVLNSGTGIFNPTIDSLGTYTYTVLSPDPACNNASATVTISFITPPNAGTNDNLDLCEDDTNIYNLFNILGGTPDSGGTWSPALNSGTGIFNPAIDSPGTYTYTVSNLECNLNDSAEVTITISELPNLTGLELNTNNICEGEDLLVNIINANSLVNGNYLITYNIIGADNLTNIILVGIDNGVGSFTISANILAIPGAYELIIMSFISDSTNCGADTSLISPIEFEIYESITPILIDQGNVFCRSDEPTVSDLSNNISNSNNITWYDNNDNIISSDTLLIDGETYYASIMSTQNCPTLNRLAVTVELTACENDLIIPDGFSPNGDTINDTFQINNLNELYPNFKLTIYNRYGNKLYRGDINTPEWDGTSNTGSSFGDSVVPVGVYFYILEFNDGNRDPIQGRLYLNM